MGDSQDYGRGSIETSSGQVLLRTQGQAYRRAEFEALPLLTLENGTRLTVGDVARVDDGFAETDQAARFDGQSSVLVKVFRETEKFRPQIDEAWVRFIGKLDEKYQSTDKRSWYLELKIAMRDAGILADTVIENESDSQVEQ